MAIARFSWLQLYFSRKTFYLSGKYAVRWLRKKPLATKRYRQLLRNRGKLKNRIKIYIMDYGGMTINERLYASGKLDKFDKAVAQKNVKKVVEILKAVELKTESIIPILESLGLEKDNVEL